MDFHLDLVSEDSIEFLGINEKTIFSSEPEWFLQAVEEGIVFLDDSDEKLKVIVDTKGTQKVLEPGGHLTLAVTEDGMKTLIVEN